MSDFTEGDFAYRNQISKRDVAEIKATTWLTDNKISYRVIGFSSKGGKIPYRQWKNVDSFLRKMPDILVLGEKGNYLMEVKGCRNKLHIKLKDLVEYSKWDALQEVYIFIYSTTLDNIYIMTLKQLIDHTSKAGFSTGTYSDNNLQFISIPVKNLKKYVKRNNHVVNKQQI